MRSALLGSAVVVALFALANCSAPDPDLPPSNGTSGTGQGASGTSGASGRGGSAGRAGSAGSAGRAGNSGSGASGSAGDAGSSGSGTDAGTSGASGNAGASGNVGASGVAGASGIAGASGTSGNAGTSGGAGADGGTAPCGGACDAALCVNGACVACTPAKDVCPKGQYCLAGNTCAQGCKAGADCASGICSSVTHECARCLSDAECGANRVCNTGVCGAPCALADENMSGSCTSGLTCCSQHCSDLVSNAQHCGVCGTACGSGEFCGLSACLKSVVGNLCSFDQIGILLDGATTDDATARSVGASISASCSTHPPVTELPQDTTNVLNTSTGQPLTHGEQLLIMPGGAFFQTLGKYLKGNAIGPVYSDVTNDQYEFFASATKTVITGQPYNGGAPNAGYDLFVIQLIRDPTSGTLVLNIQGMWAEGTQAAQLYFENVMLPAISTFDKSYYIGKWTDANGDQLPTLDEIAIQFSG